MAVRHQRRRGHKLLGPCYHGAPTWLKSGHSRQCRITRNRAFPSGIKPAAPQRAAHLATILCTSNGLTKRGSHCCYLALIKIAHFSIRFGHLALSRSRPIPNLCVYLRVKRFSCRSESTILKLFGAFSSLNSNGLGERPSEELVSDT